MCEEFPRNLLLQEGSQINCFGLSGSVLQSSVMQCGILFLFLFFIYFQQRLRFLHRCQSAYPPMTAIITKARGDDFYHCPTYIKSCHHSHQLFGLNLQLFREGRGKSGIGNEPRTAWEETAILMRASSRHRQAGRYTFEVRLARATGGWGHSSARFLRSSADPPSPKETFGIRAKQCRERESGFCHRRRRRRCCQKEGHGIPYPKRLGRPAGAQPPIVCVLFVSQELKREGDRVFSHPPGARTKSLLPSCPVSSMLSTTAPPLVNRHAQKECSFWLVISPFRRITTF